MVSSAHVHLPRFCQCLGLVPTRTRPTTWALNTSHNMGPEHVPPQTLFFPPLFFQMCLVPVLVAHLAPIMGIIFPLFPFLVPSFFFHCFSVSGKLKDISVRHFKVFDCSLLFTFLIFFWFLHPLIYTILTDLQKHPFLLTKSVGLCKNPNFHR